MSVITPLSDLYLVSVRMHMFSSMRVDLPFQRCKLALVWHWKEIDHICQRHVTDHGNCENVTSRGAFNVDSFSFELRNAFYCFLILLLISQFLFISPLTDMSDDICSYCHAAIFLFPFHTICYEFVVDCLFTINLLKLMRPVLCV